MNEVVKQILNHTSIRKFTEEGVTQEQVDAIVQCAQMASTSSHFQAYSIIEVRDPAKREVLKECSGGQKWTVTAPLVLLFCADLHRSGKYFDGIDKDVLTNTECYTVAVIDAALAAQNAFTAAESMGLGGVIVGGIRNDVQKLIDTFELPEQVAPLFALCLGHPDDNPGLKPRLPQAVVHKIDTYTEEGNDELVAKYDAEVKEYYINRGDGKCEDTWVEHCNKLMMAKTRDEVGYVFRERGFLAR